MNRKNKILLNILFAASMFAGFSLSYIYLLVEVNALFIIGHILLVISLVPLILFSKLIKGLKVTDLILQICGLFLLVIFCFDMHWKHIHTINIFGYSDLADTINFLVPLFFCSTYFIFTLINVGNYFKYKLQIE